MTDKESKILLESVRHLAAASPFSRMPGKRSTNGCRDSMKYGFLVEKVWPFFAGLITGFLYWGVCRRLGQPIYVPGNVHELLNAGITISGVAVAFIGTIEGVLLAIDSTTIIARLRELGVYNQLISYFSTAIFSCFALLIMSGILLFIDFGSTQPPIQPEAWMRWLFLFWVVFCVTTAGMCGRVLWLFSQILKK